MNGRKIGIAIGVNAYLDPKLSNLLYAKKDAEEMRDVLLNHDIGGFEKIVSLINETKQNVAKGIEKILLEDATFSDLVLIYFSGHGKLNSKFELNLLLKDTEANYLSTALHYNLITDFIEESKCKKVIIILDCCHSGAAGIRGDLSKTLSETSGSGTFVLSATTGSNLAKEVKELENGIFTHFILEGLRKGDADLGGDGLIDIIELFEYASERCNNEYSQVATMKSKFEERIVIGKNPLKIKKNKFETNMRELVKLRKALSAKLYDEAMTILIKDHQNPLSLTDIEVEIKDPLDLLLSGEIKIDTYVHTVRVLKSEEHIESTLKEASLTVKPEEKQITSPLSLSSRNLVSDFAVDKKSGVEPLIVHFTDKSIGATSWQWDFGDHSPIVATRDAEHTFGVGIWKVNLRISDGENFASKAMTITVTGITVAIVANFTVNKTSGQAPLNVQFTDASRGGVAAWSWDFGDGNKSIERNPQHTFITPGGYDVVLTVSDGKGNSATKHMRINVTAASLIAEFDANKESGLAPLSVQFTDRSTGAVSWQWNFSDNSTIVTTKNAEHIFRAGTWTVILTVSDGINFASKTMTISAILKTFISPSTGMEFVLIPAGKFMMESPSGEQSRFDDEDPAHEVINKNPFYLGKYPVTQKQWEKIMGSNPSMFVGEDLPVESVSWNDVQEFVKKLNETESAVKYRLPSEYEWEYACRAGTTTRYSFGDDESKLGGYAWYYANSGSKAHPVGQKEPNPWDLYDMHGNVWEWCQDKWHDNYEGAPSDGSAWESGSGSGRVVRGGGWLSNAGFCRSAYRAWDSPGDRDSSLGFRLLRKL